MNDDRTIFLCECRHGGLIDAERFSALRDRLLLEGARLTVMDDMCRLLARRDQRVTGPMRSSASIAVGGCFPRALRSLLASAGIDREGVVAVDVRDGKIDELVSRLMAGLERNDASVEVAVESRDDDWTAWYPVIDYGRCSGCGQCMNFCLFGVYGPDGNGRPMVERPDSCKTNCPACARVCPQAAIIFPRHPDVPINGAEVPEGESGCGIKVDVGSLMAGDLYARLREREVSAVPAKGDARTLSKFQDQLGVPDSVLSDLGVAPAGFQRNCACSNQGGAPPEDAHRQCECDCDCEDPDDTSNSNCGDGHCPCC